VAGKSASVSSLRTLVSLVAPLSGLPFEPRLVYRAGMADDFDPMTVPIRNAATVMPVRNASDGELGIEVFMLRRTANASFGAGMYVFPGGRVDDVDRATDIETFCRGLDDVEASQQLGIEAGGLAYWVASIRECFEEAGILLAVSRDGSPLSIDSGDRHAVHDGSLSMVDLCRRDDLILELSTTQYVDHWVTPVGERRRFDTRFFVTEAPTGQEGLHDDKETDDSLWVRPEVALGMERNGELMMMPPTIKNLHWLGEFTSASAAVEAGAAIENPVTVLPKIRRGDNGKIVGVAMPHDADYASL
jgi:8-oxo-dGTP pyrophosphatase MutT (NUDIX family)